MIYNILLDVTIHEYVKENCKNANLLLDFTNRHVLKKERPEIYYVPYRQKILFCVIL